MFKGRKIKNLILKYEEAVDEKAQSEIISELKQYGKPAITSVLDLFRERKIRPGMTEYLLDNLCDNSSFVDIVPLICEPYHEMRRIAKEMIIKKWKEPAVPFLLEYLKSEDRYSRTNAAELLSIIKDPKSVVQLVGMFNSANPGVKEDIITILSRIGGEAAKKLMISALNDESYDVQRKAVKFIGKLTGSDCSDCVEPLLERLDSEDPNMKILSLDALGAIGDKRAAPRLIELLKDKDLLVRQKATDYIIEIADSGVVPQIIELMKDDDVNIRRCAIEVLNNLKDPNTSHAVMEAMKDSDWWVRQIATDALTDMKGDNILKGFLAMAKDKDENIRRCATEFFAKVPDKAAFDALITLLRDDDWWVRDKAILALSKLKDRRAIQPIAEMINDEETRRSVPEALAEIGGKDVLEHLKAFLSHEIKVIRIEAIKAIEKTNDQGALPLLKNCLQDPEKEVRDQAVLTLKEMTGKTFKPGDAPPPGPQKSGFPSVIPAEGSIVAESIVVLDQCDSTEIAQIYGDNVVLNRMKYLTDIISQIGKKENYQFLKSTGDGFLITFPDIAHSLKFAFSLLQIVRNRNSTAEDPDKIDLRLAINSGETRIDENGDRLGMAVNMAFRVEGLKPDGLISIDGGMEKEGMPLKNRVFITENVQKQIINAKGVEIKLVGLFELKGITGLHKIFDVKLGNNQ